MKKGIYITYRNTNLVDIFQENDLDCSRLTVSGYASQLIDCWLKSSKQVVSLDNYNAINLEEVISIRVIK